MLIILVSRHRREDRDCLRRAQATQPLQDSLNISAQKGQGQLLRSMTPNGGLNSSSSRWPTPSSHLIFPFDIGPHRQLGLAVAALATSAHQRLKKKEQHF